MPSDRSSGGTTQSELPECVAGWILSEASQSTGGPGGNYEHPYQDRVYVNIQRPDAVSTPGLWLAKYNDHGDGSERIRVSDDYSEVVAAAISWMRQNPADTDRSGQQRLVTDGGRPSSDTEQRHVRLTMGQLDQLPNWAACCTDCGAIHAQQVDCPVCSLRADK